MRCSRLCYNREMIGKHLIKSYFSSNYSNSKECWALKYRVIFFQLKTQFNSIKYNACFRISGKVQALECFSKNFPFLSKFLNCYFRPKSTKIDKGFLKLREKHSKLFGQFLLIFLELSKFLLPLGRSNTTPTKPSHKIVHPCAHNRRYIHLPVIYT